MQAEESPRSERRYVYVQRLQTDRLLRIYRQARERVSKPSRWKLRSRVLERAHLEIYSQQMNYRFHNAPPASSLGPWLSLPNT